jgi:hypothetical protein
MRIYGADKVYVLSFTGAVIGHLSARFDTENASTVYRAFQRCMARCKNRNKVRDGEEFSPDTKKPEIVVIDEFPMIDNVNFAMALAVFHKTQRRILLLGDENQIKPIGVGRPMDGLLSLWKRCSSSGEEEKRRMINVIRLDPANNFRISPGATSSLLRDILSAYVERNLNDIVRRLREDPDGCAEQFRVVPFETIRSSSKKEEEEEESAREKVYAVIESIWTPPSKSDWLGCYSDVQFLCLERKPCKIINDSCDAIALKRIHDISLFGRGSKKAGLNKIFYVGQKIAIKLRNVVIGRRGIFNGEMYLVKGILASSAEGDAGSEESQGPESVDVSGTDFRASSHLACAFGNDGSATCFSSPGESSNLASPSRIFLRLSKLNDRRDGDRTVSINAGPRKTGERSYRDGSFPVFPLSLEQTSSAWAITVNKSQGPEYDTVCFCILFRGEEENFSKGHGLVALSRSKKKLTFVGDGDLSSLLRLSEKEDDSKRGRCLASNFDFYLESCFFS